MTYSFRLTEEENRIFRMYARIKKISLAQLIKETLLEKIEDEFDLMEVEKAYEEFDKTCEKAKPIDKLWEELKL